MIHPEHPFSDPAAARDVVRQFRGRLASPVTVWTAGEGVERVGLTVSSVQVANGTPPEVIALLDPLSDLVDLLPRTGRAVVNLLAGSEWLLAEQFAGRAPAPGGLFHAEMEQLGWGPVLPGVRSWAGVSLISVDTAGWSHLVRCRLDHVVLADEADPLVHHRGEYRRLIGR